VADTLRTLNEAIAQLPDNAAQLIQPIHVREAIYSLAPDGITVSLEPPVPVTVPILGSADLNVDLFPQLNGDESLYWDLDGNGAAGPGSYPGDVVIPPGHARLVTISGIVSFEATTAETYTFTFTRDGTPIGDPFTVETSTQLDTYQASSIHGELQAYDPTPRYGIRVTSSAPEIVISNYELRATGRPQP